MMKRLATVVVLLGLLPLSATAQLADQIEALAGSSPALRGAFWGAKVIDVETGETIYEHSPDHYFVPASNAKLFATALALRRLGPDHRFETLIVADAEPDAEGTISGDLRLIGGGDPTMSSREYPYQGDSASGNGLAPLEALAESLADKGVRLVPGDIVGDDTAYPWEPYPDGWAMDDTIWDYGAPVSALALHDNYFRLSILPARRLGEPARLVVRPPTEYYHFRNGVETMAQGVTAVSIDWPLGSREISVGGAILPGEGRAKLLAIRDPAHYAAWVLKEALERRGIPVQGEPKALHRRIDEVPDGGEGSAPARVQGVILARRQSPPLIEILQVTNKLSLNLHAELMLHEVGRSRRGNGSREAGLAELRSFLAEAGVDVRAYDLEDASGLSRLNLVTPSATVQLLRYMYLSEDRDGWVNTLAVGGSDGTLEHRFRGDAVAGRVHAKTGTMTHVGALSGYADSHSRGAVAFSLYVNNYTASDGAARSFLDSVVRVILE